MRLRSLVGIVPLFAVEVLEEEQLAKLPGFHKRLQWYLRNRADLAQSVYNADTRGGDGHTHRLLAITTAERLTRVLRFVLDENEFLSPFGVRSLSRRYLDQPFVFQDGDEERVVRYVPGDSDSRMFGGNSNWRGPIWLPMNYLLIEALERYDHFYGDDLRVECPTGSGRLLRLRQVAVEIARRIARLFLPDETGVRPCQKRAPDAIFGPHGKDLVLFHEYFDGDTGRGLGASHQTGWTALIVRLLEDLVREDAGGF